MRPALQALGAQQKLIEAQAEVITAQSQRIGQLMRVASSQRGDIARLGRGLRAIAEAAGIEGHVKSAMLRTADEQNPAQPVPSPPAQPAPYSTQETETPEAMDDVLQPGMTPGSTKDVAADATSTVYTPGADIPPKVFNNLVDVTAPVEGTEGPRPVNEVRTETDVRVGNPMAPAPAFPLRGDFANAPRLGSVQGGAQPGSAANPIREDGGGNRTMASLRLARLRMDAGYADGDNDFAVATGIEKDATLSMEAIEREIVTLEHVRTATQQRVASKGLVPKAAAGVQRTVPSMQGVSHVAGSGDVDQDVADADLFS